MIRIGYDFDNNKPITGDEPKQMVSEEVELLNTIIDKLSVPNEWIRIVKNCDDYTTAQYKGVDLIRIKSTPKAQWIKIRVNPYEMKNIADSPLFSLQANKKETMWKCRLEDINELYVYLEKAISSFNKPNEPYIVNNDETEIIEKIMNILQINDYEINKTSECVHVYLKDSCVVLFDIKCGKKSSWIEVRDTSLEKISINDLTDEVLNKVIDKIKKELKKRVDG